MTTEDMTEMWLIYIKNEDFLDAISLAYSLRRVGSNRKIYALIPDSLVGNTSFPQDVFDGWIILPENRLAKEKLGMDAYAKLFCGSVEQWSKICFMDSKCCVLRECDDLFGKLGPDSQMVIFNKTGLSHEEHPCFLLKPRKNYYDNLMNNLIKNWENSNYEDMNLFGHFLKTLQTTILDDSWFQPLTSAFNSGNSQIPAIVWPNDVPVAANILSDVSKTISDGINQAKKNVSSQNFLKSAKGNEPIAIVGFSCRFPGSDGEEEFWNLLVSQGCSITPVPADRWTPEKSCVLDNDSSSREAGFLKCPIDAFDDSFFEISHAELKYMDPQQRLLLEVAWEGLEDAVINPLSLTKKNVGIFTGSWTQDYRDLLIESGFKGTEFFRSYMGNAFAASSARLSYFLGTTGPNIAIESGCSASSVGLKLACDSLRSGESDLSLSCGANLLVHPYRLEDMKAMCSPDSRCKSFDEKADGFVRSEGVAVLVLKRLTDALRDEDRIRGIIRGFGLSQDGNSKSMGTPTSDCEKLAMQTALQNAQVSPIDVSYIEAHATGTAIGDPIEIEAISRAYATSSARTSPLLLGSVKPNIGHTESCSGLASIIKVLKCFEHEVLPPLQSLGVLNPAIVPALKKLNAAVPLMPTPWPKSAVTPRIAGVSSYGITGSCTHLILEEPPSKTPFPVTSHQFSYNILTASAKTEAALTQLLERYRNRFQNPPITDDIHSIAFTLNTGRAHFPYRAAIVGENMLELSKADEWPVSQIQHKGMQPKLCFLFTGQGSQYQGMGLELYNNFAAFRKAFDSCNSLLNSQFGICLTAAIWGNNKHLLNLSIYSQSAIFVVNYSIFKLLRNLGLKPDYVLGHSLGEFNAAVAAGLMNYKDALFLVASRGRLVDKMTEKGSMIALQAGIERASDIKLKFEGTFRNRWIDIAAVNSLNQTVLAGKVDCIKEFKSFCTDLGISSHILDSQHAYHSRQMDVILPELIQIAKSRQPVKIMHKSPKPLFMSSTTGRIMTELNSQYWCDQTRGKVQFTSGVQNLMDLEVTTFLEVGSANILVNLVKQITGTANKSIAQLLFCQKSGNNNFKTFLEALANLYKEGYDIKWDQFHKNHSKQKLHLPFYPFQRKSHWFPPQQLSSKTSSSLRMDTDGQSLVGKLFKSPAGSQVFTRNISFEEIPWVKDHAIGNLIVCPGSSYLEMGLSVADRLNLPLCLENLKIEAAWGADLSQSNNFFELQAIVEPETTQLSIHSRGENNPDRWTCHARAQYGKSNVFELLHNLKPLSELLLEKRSQTLSDVYGYIKPLGYNFGQLFHTVKTVFNSDSDCLCEIVMPTESHLYSNEGYVLHPIAIDAMLQAVLLARIEEIHQLIVPVAIDNFAVSSKLHCKNFTAGYVHVYGENRNHATLYDKDGGVVASLTGLMKKPTTVQAITDRINVYNNSVICPKMEPMFKEVWSPSSGEGSLPPFLPTNLTKSEEPLTDLTRNIAIPPLATWDSMDALNKCIGALILKAFLKMGFAEFQQRSSFNASDVMARLNIPQQSHTLLFLRRLLEILQESGWLSKVQEYHNIYDTFQVTNGCLPTTTDLQDKINATSDSFNNSNSKVLDIEWEYSLKFGGDLTSFLKLEASPLELLFTGRDKTFSAERFYDEAIFAMEANQSLTRVFEELISRRYHSENAELRILEIGAGTGSATTRLLPILMKNGITVEYTFTDLSSSFFPSAEAKFRKYSRLIYKSLNIEQNPLSQGFPPLYYDIVVASNVLHATKDLRETCENVRKVLKSSGQLILVETFHPQPYLDIVVGHLEGYWRQGEIDSVLRPTHCVIDELKWGHLLKSVGFMETASVQVCHGGLGVVVAQNGNQQLPPTLQQRPQSPVWFIAADSGNSTASQLATRLDGLGISSEFLNLQVVLPLDQDHCVQPYNILALASKIQMETKHRGIAGFIYIQDFAAAQVSFSHVSLCLSFLQAILKQQLDSEKDRHTSSPPFKVVLAVPNTFADSGSVLYPTGGELVGLMKVFANETPRIPVKIVDIFPENNPNFLLQELYLEFDHLCIAYRDNIRLAPKLLNFDFPLTFPSLKFPNPELSKYFRIALSASKTISDLSFTPIQPEESFVGEHQLGIEIQTAALNFRDLLLVFQSVENNYLGFGSDIAGIVTKVGKGVTRFKIGDIICAARKEASSQQPLPSFTVLHEEEVARVPSSWSLEQAATLPIVFFTAYHSLVTLGKLQAGDTILLHTASGGVGLCAIQIAKQIGAKVIATAGSPRKRTYLSNLGVEHVLESRSLKFKKEIESITQGKGVRLVLNSLTGPGFKEASLASLGKGGKFIEMSKLNIWEEQEVHNLRPDISYHIVDISVADSERWRQLTSKLEESMKSGAIRHLPYTLFDVADIRDALQFQQKALHIGKVVLKFPIVSSPIPSIQVKCLLFNSQSTYLITGGTRGIGLSVAEWMVAQGARFLILAGRSTPPAQSLDTIQKLQENGKASILVISLDVGDYESCKELFIKISNSKTYPPIRGVMHAAGYISDYPIPKQNMASLTTCLNPKMLGTWNLHKLTQHTPLEHFVLFSSISAVFGTPGQANHASANSWMDSFAKYCHSIGLPALSINWGQWGQVGVVAGREIHGITPMNTDSALNTLEHLLRAHASHAAVVNGDVLKWKTLWPWTASYLKDANLGTSIKAKTASLVETRSKIDSPAIFWEKYETNKKSNDDKSLLHYLRDIVRRIVSVILQMEVEHGDGKEDIYSKELHLDSLMVIELNNMIQSMLGDGCILRSGDLTDASSINTITNQLQTALLKRNESKTTGNENNWQELAQKDCILWPETQISKDNIAPVPVTEIRNIFLTGVTGNLGPYLLQIISNLPSVQTIYCLVRSQSKSGLSPKSRLYSTLKNFSLLDSVDIDKVSIIEGELTERHFGLSEFEYLNLTNKIDCVFHSGAYSNHLDDYQQDGKEMSKLRAVNVLGTQRILKFATETKTKWVFYTSSAIVILNPNKEGNGLPEDWQNNDSFNSSPNFGYAISKFVAEQLVKEAVLSRGLPCKVFRLPLICGESKNGMQNVYQNHFFLKYVYYFQQGIMPPENLPLFFLPVDVAAQICTDIFFNPESAIDVYNVINPIALDEQELPRISANYFGNQIRIVPYPEFVKGMEQDPLCLLRHVVPFYTGGETKAKYKKLLESLKYIDIWKKNPNSKFFLSHKVLKYIPDLEFKVENPTDIFVRDLRYVVENTDLLPNITLSKG